MAEEQDALVARIDRLLAEPVPVEAEDVDLADAIVMTAWGRPWIYQGPIDTYRVSATSRSCAPSTGWRIPIG